MESVTGISRSGRVRKKSSKLMDYESPVDDFSHPKNGLSSVDFLPPQQLLMEDEDDDDSMDLNEEDLEQIPEIDQESNDKHRSKSLSKLTGYQLWAKGVRNELIEKNPKLEFASISKKLAQLWSQVPHSEKYK